MHTVTHDLVEMVGDFEGFVPTLYNDPADHATIGFGHLVHTGPINGSEPARFKQGITRQEAIDLLRGDLANAEVLVNREVVVDLKPHHFDALVSFAFNVGRGNFTSSALLTRLNSGEFDAVPGELARWVFGGGKPLPGLVRRRHREGTLFARGIYRVIRPGEYVNQEVINAFARADTKLGLPLWTLLRQVGMTPEQLAERRRELYSGTPVAQLTGLTEEERLALLAELPADIPLADVGGARALEGFLSQSSRLATVPLRPDLDDTLRVPDGADALLRRIVRAWNRYGALLTAIADELGLDPALTVAVLACTGGSLDNPHLPSGLYRTLGYDSAEQMAESFADERWRLVGLFDLIAGPNGSSRELAALRLQDWTTFAALHYGTDRAERSAQRLALAVEWVHVLSETRDSDLAMF